MRPVALSSAQQAALAHVRRQALAQQARARARIEAQLYPAGCSIQQWDDAMHHLGERGHARVCMHFHPDRLDRQGRLVAQGLLADGTYRSQFETGLSSGSRTAHPGGERDEWERVLFGGAYHAPGVSAAERPCYGALALIDHPDGPAPRFGSCYLVLRPQVLQRTTFTFAGSEQAQAAERVGDLAVLDSVMAALLDEITRGEGTRVPWPPWHAPTLGVPGLSVAGLVARLSRRADRPRPSAPGRVLDSGIEAQVHGPILLGRDVVALVTDPAFDATPTGALLDALCQRHGLVRRRHGGFRLAASAVPADFRGPAMPELARRIAGPDGVLDAAVIGTAERSLPQQPDQTETRQHLKQLWHVLVHHGTAASV
jgi:Protein of unknown function (DUF3626)